MYRSAILLLLLPALATAQAPKQEAVTFKDHVQPILRKHCLNCHNADKSSADLDISSYAKLMAGGSSGEAVKAGNSGQSLLYKVTSHDSEPKMPPKGGKIPDADLAVLKKWIDGGAPETAVGAAKAATRKVDGDEG
jgi:mono/diheme cytochrome c family protein